MLGSLCSYVAGQKNRSQVNWFFLGFFLSLLALIALAAIPSLSKQAERKDVNSSQQEGCSNLNFKCPFCAEFVKAEATICRFCQRELPPVAQPTTKLVTDDDAVNRTQPHPTPIYQPLKLPTPPASKAILIIFSLFCTMVLLLVLNH